MFLANFLSAKFLPGISSEGGDSKFFGARVGKNEEGEWKIFILGMGGMDPEGHYVHTKIRIFLFSFTSKNVFSSSL